MHPTRWLAIRIARQPWMPRFTRQIVAVDQWLRRLTRGRITLLTLAGLPQLFLTVPGRRTGIPRTIPLLCVPHEGGWLIAGSFWGAPRPPLWVGNLLAASTATVEFRGRETAVTARQVEGEERSRLWEVMVGTWPNYATYAERTDREIPVFFLAPR